MKFPILKSGDSSIQVREWQQFLVDKEMLSPDPLISGDGIFGVGTEHGTKAYQKSKGLPPTGIVDAETYARAVQDGFGPNQET